MRLGSFSSGDSRRAIALGISSTAIKLACSPACWPPMPSATMNRLDGSSVKGGHLAVAFRVTVVPHRPPAGHIKIIFVVLPVVPPHRDDSHFQLELARQKRERGKRGEFLGRFAIALFRPRPKRCFIQLHQSRKPAHLRFTLPARDRSSSSIIPICVLTRLRLLSIKAAQARPARSLS